MPIIRELAQKYLRTFDFKTLFIQQLGWNNYNSRPLYISIDQQAFTLRGVVEKRGMVVYVCEPASNGSIPLSPIRLKIEKEVTKITYEHIIIYIDAKREHQVWQWMRREPGKPTASREIPFSKNQTGEALLQKLPGIAFELDQEEHLTTSYVTSSVRQAFDVDRVTKRFYDRFKAEHATFLRFIEGIPVEGDREWYASLMLNRLMFVYFIQKKGFLDNNEHYLRNRLRAVQEHQGNGNFLNFYRHFLLRLFHEGLGKQEHSTELEVLLGKVPYLNGGLFDVHELERANQHIQIADEAFEKLFDFFDAYQWHLDERPLRADNEINPDVLGYIFEKYINQKQMGAYYTKEDITDYIGKNTILPFLFDAAENKCLIAFEPHSALWRLLQENPNNYIYEAVKKGVELPLPPEIAVGLDDVSQRTEWNKPATGEYALPTEIWREVVERRKRYEEVRTKLVSGEVHSINDLITYNLDIKQFAHDVIESSEGPELVRAFYNSIIDLTVLDPTCGSGAFLFAALNILEPLYEACLERMQSMVSDRDRLDEHGTAHGRRSGQQSLADFRAVLKQVQEHPNRRYFILKSIIINNLYGVDIMEEATEICKLRIFLKLVAQIDHVEDIEPLPDIDFNIRAGNTLIGFVNEQEIKAAIEHKMDFDNTLENILLRAQEIERSFEDFRKLQTVLDLKNWDIAESKRHLHEKLDILQSELDRYLSREYGVDSLSAIEKGKYKERLERWKQSHQPFHWFVEFYGIMKRGGFDVIIGNPPYVEYSEVFKQYTIRTYKTESCGNLYAYILERSMRLQTLKGRCGMIIPHSSFCTDRMGPLMRACKSKYNVLWMSSYCIRPAKLFVGVDQRLAIVIGKIETIVETLYATKYHRWQEESRIVLFDTLEYENTTNLRFPNSIPKIHSLIETSLWIKLASFREMGVNFIKPGISIYFHNAPRYWIRAMTFAPYFWGERVGEKLSTQVKTLTLPSDTDANVVATVMNSSLFYWWFILLSDCRHLNMREIEHFPLGLDLIQETYKKALVAINQRLMADYQKNAVRKEAQYKTTGKIAYDEYYPKHSKPIIDEIDRVLAWHYCFTDEELDFIINYDIKYRMGRDSSEEDG